jgi:hypothetical protein
MPKAFLKTIGAAMGKTLEMGKNILRNEGATTKTI